MMPRYILKIHDDKLNTDWYLEWSTVVDAPVTDGMTKREFTEYYKRRYGTSSEREFGERMERVERVGSSCYFDNDGIDGYFEWNRAGDNETSLNKEEILELYCRQGTPQGTLSPDVSVPDRKNNE